MQFFRPAVIALVAIPITASCQGTPGQDAEELLGSAESAVVTPPAPVLVGTLGNFDALNDTGQEAHGFEIDQ